MSLLTFISTETDAEEQAPSGWLTTLGLVLLVGVIIDEITGVRLSDSFKLTSDGITFLSIYFAR